MGYAFAETTWEARPADPPRKGLWFVCGWAVGLLVGGVVGWYSAPRESYLRDAAEYKLEVLRLRGAMHDALAQLAAPWYAQPPKRLRELAREASERLERDGVDVDPGLFLRALAAVQVRRVRPAGDMDARPVLERYRQARRTMDHDAAVRAVTAWLDAR